MFTNHCILDIFDYIYTLVTCYFLVWFRWGVGAEK